MNLSAEVPLQNMGPDVFTSSQSPSVNFSTKLSNVENLYAIAASSVQGPPSPPISPRSRRESFADRLSAQAVHRLGGIAIKGKKMSLSFRNIRYQVKGKTIVHSVR